MPILPHILIFGVLAFMLGLPAWLFWRQDQDYKRRKKKYEDDKKYENDAAFFRAQRLQMLAVLAAVDKQKTEQPAVTVPVTNCERQERRRILKLES